MSTTAFSIPRSDEIKRLDELGQFLHDLGDEQHLLQADRLTTRLEALDKLDAIVGDIGDLDVHDAQTTIGADLILRARSLRSRCEAANATLYGAAHADIALTGKSLALERWLAALGRDAETERPHPGLSFDLLDEIVSGVLQFRGPGGDDFPLSREMTAYQPTPARHILHLIAACKFSSDDVLVDLGSGLGHVPLLVGILAGIRTISVEVQPDHAASAHETAHSLRLSRVQFIAEDARETDLSTGTVFYMFTPFSGSILTEVLDRLRRQSKLRKITVCALGPCSRILQQQTWLTAKQPQDTERISVFRSL